MVNVEKDFSLESEKMKNWNGKDFEFLICRVEDYNFGSDFEISEKDFYKVMTPNTFEYEVLNNSEWNLKVGNNTINYSWEPPGIQMTFNEEIDFTTAKKIADEVIENLIKYTGHKAKLLILPNDGTIISFN